MNEEGYGEVDIFKRPVIWGIIAGLSLMSVYFIILTVANSFLHAIEQFKELWYWMVLLVSGFGLQAGLYTYIRGMVRLRRQSGVATSSVATAGGISTTSMVACCAHHLTDVLPVLGISAAVVFLSKYQNLFIIAGVLSNLIGINLMLKIIQEHGLYQTERGLLSSIMRLNMKRSLYLVSILSTFTLLLTLYKSM